MEHEGEEEGERLGLGMFLRAGYMLMEWEGKAEESKVQGHLRRRERLHRYRCSRIEVGDGDHDGDYAMASP